MNTLYQNCQWCHLIMNPTQRSNAEVTWQRLWLQCLVSEMISVAKHPTSYLQYLVIYICKILVIKKSRHHAVLIPDICHYYTDVWRMEQELLPHPAYLIVVLCEPLGVFFCWQSHCPSFFDLPIPLFIFKHCLLFTLYSPKHGILFK
jgi:hypothetical protein